MSPCSVEFICEQYRRQPKLLQPDNEVQLSGERARYSLPTGWWKGGVSTVAPKFEDETYECAQQFISNLFLDTLEECEEGYTVEFEGEDDVEDCSCQQSPLGTDAHTTDDVACDGFATWMELTCERSISWANKEALWKDEEDEVRFEDEDLQLAPAIASSSSTPPRATDSFEADPALDEVLRQLELQLDPASCDSNTCTSGKSRSVRSKRKSIACLPANAACTDSKAQPDATDSVGEYFAAGSSLNALRAKRMTMQTRSLSSPQIASPGEHSRSQPRRSAMAMDLDINIACARPQKALLQDVGKTVQKSSATHWSANSLCVSKNAAAVISRSPNGMSESAAWGTIRKSSSVSLLPALKSKHIATGPSASCVVSSKKHSIARSPSGFDATFSRTGLATYRW